MRHRRLSSATRLPSGRTADETRHWRAFRAGVQGDKGEAVVSVILDGRSYPAMHDVIVPTPEGRVTQIDHMVLGPDGLHVIETKRLGGALQGHPEDEHWQQSFTADRPDAPPRMIYSPIRQNQAHCRAVYAIVRPLDPAIAVRSHVVMTGSAVLAPALRSAVLTADGLVDLLDGFQGKRPMATLMAAWSRLLESADRHEARRDETRRSS